MNHRSSLSVLPSAPGDLVAVAVGGFQVILAWTKCGENVLGFHIGRADGIGSACRFSQVGRTVAHVTAWRDESVTPRKTYSYRVHARNALGDSIASNMVEVTTPRADMELSADTD